MATVAAATRSSASDIPSPNYERFAGVCAILTGGVGFLYSVTFVVLRQRVLDATSPLVLLPALLVGFIASPVFYVWLGLNLRRSP